MKITVITVVFNGARYISDCIRSVTSQDHSDLEHIIIDGGSSDGTLEIIDRERSESSILISEPDKGMYDAINKGIRLATGSVIGFLHADDLFADPSVVRKIAAAFSQYDPDAVYGDLDYVQASTLKIARKWRSRQFRHTDLNYGWMPAHPTLYVKKSVYEAAGAYSLDFGSAADYEMMLRLLYTMRIRAIYLPLLIIRMRLGGMSNKNWESRIHAFYQDQSAAKLHKLPMPLIATLLKKFRKVSQFF